MIDNPVAAPPRVVRLDFIYSQGPAALYHYGDSLAWYRPDEDGAEDNMAIKINPPVSRTRLDAKRLCTREAASTASPIVLTLATLAGVVAESVSGSLFAAAAVGLAAFFASAYVVENSLRRIAQNARTRFDAGD